MYVILTPRHFSLVGLASAVTNNSAWRPGVKYVYNVESHTLTRHSKNYCSGIVMQAKFTVTPKSENVLMAMISNVQYARFQDKSSGECTAQDINNSHQLAYKPLNLAEKPFRIDIENGLIKKIHIYENLETYKINLLRSVISEFQFDINGENLIHQNGNQLPKQNTFPAVFKTMESTTVGKYSTLYEVKVLPDVVTQDRPELIPYPQLKGTDGDIVEVVKTKDYSNSKERIGYHYGLGNKDHWEPFSNKVGDFFSRTGVTRGIITGKPSQYTIQTVETTETIAVSPLHNSKEKFTVISSNRLTLINFEPNSPQLEEPSSLKPSLYELTYQYNKQHPSDNYQRQNQQNGNEQYPYGQTNGNQGNQNFGDNNRNYFDEESSYSNDFDSMSSEHKWQQNHPSLQNAPESPLLPFTMGYMGQAIKNNQNINIIEVVKTLANNIGHYFENQQSHNQQDSLSNFLTLNALVRTMDASELQTVTEILYNNEEGTLNNYAWKAFRDCLAEAGTGPALVILQKLILEDKIPNYMASIIVQQITHSVRQPTEQYMRALFDFTKNKQILAKPHLNFRIILGFATLTRKVYVSKDYSHDQYPVHSFGRFDTPSGIKFVVNEYVPYLQERLEEAIVEGNYYDTQMYIAALGHVAHRSILNVFRPYFNGSKYATPFQRLQMVLALRYLATYSPKLVQSVLFKIYQNLGEQEDVRVASVFLLMKTKPSAYIFQRMAVYINVDPSEQVNSAVEESIRSMARLEGHEFDKVRQNAQSALHLLPGKTYRMQYSRKYMRNYYISEINVEFKEILETIGAADSAMPKLVNYDVYTNIGGIKRNQFTVNYMANSVDQLIHALLRQTETHQLHQKQKQSDRGTANQWSAENIFRILNVRRYKPEPLEGRLNFEIEGMKTSFMFNDADIQLLPQVMEQVEHQLQNKNTFYFTKFINNDDMTMSVPTVTGMPAIYTSDNPSLMHLDGEGSVVAQPKISSEGVLHTPENLKANGEINVYILKKRQGQLGFVTPFDNHHYLAGYERNFQFQVSLNADVVGNIQGGRYSFDIKPVELQKNQQLLHFNALPYIAVRDISNFEPIISGKDTYIIKEDHPFAYKSIIGEDETGIALQIQFENDNQLNWAWVYRQIKNHSPLSLLMSPWYDDSVYYSTLNVAFDAKHSSNDRFQVQIGYKQSNRYENCPKASGVDIKDLYKTATESQSRLNQFYQKVCSGISSSSVRVYDGQVKFEGQQEISYFATAGVANSNTDENSHFLFYVRKQPSNQHKTRPYSVALHAKARIPKTNGIDPLFALQADYNANVQGQLVFGESEQSSSEINMQATLEKSKKAKENLKNTLLVDRCKKEIELGDYQLSACNEVMMKAKSVDHVLVKIQHQKMENQVKRLTTKLLDAFKSRFNHYFEQNSVEPTENVQNQIHIDAQFHNDFEKVSVDIQSEKVSMLFRNVDIHRYVRSVVNFYPVHSTQSSIFASAYGLALQTPSCVIDQNFANTLENLTYPVQLGNDWAVALLYAPGYANVYQSNEKGWNSFQQQTHQNRGLQQQGQYQNQQFHSQPKQSQGNQLQAQNHQRPNYLTDQHERQPQQHQGFISSILNHHQQHLNRHRQKHQQNHPENHHKPNEQNQQWTNELEQNQNQQENWQNQQNQNQNWQQQNQQQSPQRPEQEQQQQQNQQFQNVQHNADNQIEHYAVLVRNMKNSKHGKEVKVILRSYHTKYENMEIDMVPSEKSKMRAEVYVNEKKQNVHPEHGLQFNDYMRVNVLPNGEVAFAVQNVFYILYDGQRFRLTILDSSKFRNDVRGLCGVFNGNNRFDFTCPQNCILQNAEQFVDSYKLNNQSQNQHSQHQCSYSEVIYADVISNEAVGLLSKNQGDSTNYNRGCTRHQTRYFYDDGGKVCFTVKMHPICKQHCKPKQQITKTVGVYCVPQGQNTELWIKEIEKGASPDFSIKTPSKHVPIDVDQSCSAHA
ncbi:hypothetical protein FQR65_LT12283 [Abscondita terminalis]|nr:hypothetical protein FQR65_LT12283 [Abscondita terminalis]